MEGSNRKLSTEKIQQIGVLPKKAVYSEDGTTPFVVNSRFCGRSLKIDHDTRLESLRSVGSWAVDFRSSQIGPALVKDIYQHSKSGYVALYTAS
jgi:hypothetical protein